MIRVTHQIAIDEADVQIEFVRSPGPGGQNVNKVATAAQLRFDVRGCRTLPPAVRERVERQCAGRINSEGFLILTARRHRSQKMNREDALERLTELIRIASVAPRPRRKTAPTAASRRRRLDDKRRQSERKQLRREPGL
jgi:ribosome-associated protein